jgi:galactokinase
MHRSEGYSAAAFMSAAILFAHAAQPMEIHQFDKMATADQSEYVGLLVGGAEQVLKDEGRADLAAKVEQLFTRTDSSDADTLGMVEFELNLARARVTDAKNVVKDPDAHRIAVEDAMAVTLKKNGIDLPQTFFTVASSFKPKFPPH